MTPTLVVAAGRHDRRDCPVWFDPPDGAGETFVFASEGGRGYAAQRAGPDPVGQARAHYADYAYPPAVGR